MFSFCSCCILATTYKFGGLCVHECAVVIMAIAGAIVVVWLLWALAVVVVIVAVVSVIVAVVGRDHGRCDCGCCGRDCGCCGP